MHRRAHLGAVDAVALGHALLGERVQFGAVLVELGAGVGLEGRGLFLDAPGGFVARRLDARQAHPHLGELAFEIAHHLLVLDQIELGRRARLHQGRHDIALLLGQRERAGERFIARLQFGDVLLALGQLIVQARRPRS